MSRTVHRELGRGTNGHMTTTDTVNEIRREAEAARIAAELAAHKAADATEVIKSHSEDDLEKFHTIINSQVQSNNTLATFMAYVSDRNHDILNGLMVLGGDLDILAKKTGNEFPQRERQIGKD